MNPLQDTLSSDIPPDWIIPDWPAPPGVRALCTTRSGGVSAGGFASCNLGSHVGDDAAHVLQNRERLARAMHALDGKNSQNAAPVFLHQIHGCGVLALDADSPRTAQGRDADACVSATPGVGCAIMVADCLPVLFCHADAPAVGAAHAGWRGLAGGVLASSFGALAALVREQGGAEMAGLTDAQIAAQTLAWLGPCIGQADFEVGAEVRAAFVAQDAGAAACFAPGPAGRPGKSHADLAALARRRLAQLGITQVYGNDGSERWCTVRNPQRFFSHRRDGAPQPGGQPGGTGRFAACVWLQG